MSDTLPVPVRELLARGVVMPVPEAVCVDPCVVPERVAPGVVLHPGTRLTGETTSIGPGSVIGAEGPVTLADCQLGHEVSVKSGYAQGAVLLDGAGLGANAHVRPGTVLEEEASTAHAVGLKQTIWMSYVTGGSLINFCDALMAGGTSRKNHSEIGSSYIHFNFTPHGDKATPSLIGDVPRGVLLDQPPIFLGGQGGMAGPVRLEYGVVVAAGAILRKDALQPGCLYVGGEGRSTGGPIAYAPGRYGDIRRIVRNNMIYIGNIKALACWYRSARVRFMRRDPFREACRLGALHQLDVVLKERIKRMQDLSERVATSMDRRESAEGKGMAVDSFHQAFVDLWPSWKERLKRPVPESSGAAHRAGFQEEWERLEAASHIAALQGLSLEGRRAARAWLQAVVDQTVPDMGDAVSR